MQFLAGILLIFLGICAIALPLMTSLTVVWVLAWILMIGGIVHFIGAFRAWSFAAGAFAALVGIAYFVIGWTMLGHPAWGLETIAMVISLVLLIEGAITLAAYFSSAGNRSAWTLLSGVLAIVLGVIVWSMGATAAAFLVATIVGINLISSGMTRIMVASAVNRVRKAISG
jgi:uncharacterized membrane protein HdeD (DUF308 family)